MNDKPYKTRTEVFKARDGAVWLKQLAFWKSPNGEEMAPKKALVQVDDEVRNALRPFLEEESEDSSPSRGCRSCAGSPVLPWDGFYSLDEKAQRVLFEWLV